MLSPVGIWSEVEVAVPGPAVRLPGVSMAGFSQRGTASWDIDMVAHPSVTLLLDLSEGDGAIYDNRGRRRQGSVAIGLLPGDLRAAGWARVECLQIRLEPTRAAAVLGVSADLSGEVVSMHDVWGRGSGRLEDMLRAAGSWDQRFRIAAETLAPRLFDRAAVDPEVVHAWRRTLTSRGRVRVDGLADTVGWSRKRLWSRFRAQLGITPKRAARLVRFDHAAHLLAAGHDVARVASESGYVDQSHLHREVKEFAGLTPTGVAAAPWLAIDDLAWPAPPGGAISRRSPGGRRS
ncbi:helix-turn-helix domain-containing protein [Actinoplanes sp. NPDC051633]|uniref:helix-turn-helix domain-containing protein n=1 Tax=Actinoplanes sp. NPDC051633 TaxID=3155670 RepID=UPI0034255911